ncbi:c-type cytochrome [Pistricoccus aurantiacus]|uniref:c-type cytochrome n=1 Tax=Pistricoccus aurantiacus TaxID=1883414 RepID=UPI003625BB90
MKKIVTAIALLGCASFAVTAQAAGDAEAGAKKIAVCVACHGKDGKATAPIYPNLAGQSAQYLESSLKAYREDQRSGGMAAMMTPQAKALSDEDIADLAAYYSSQEP